MPDEVRAARPRYRIRLGGGIDTVEAVREIIPPGSDLVMQRGRKTYGEYTHRQPNGDEYVTVEAPEGMSKAEFEDILDNSITDANHEKFWAAIDDQDDPK